MALTLKFNIAQSDDGKTLVFHETTGGAASTTGWGYAGNPDLDADVTAAYVEITSESNDITSAAGAVDIKGAVVGTNPFPWDSDDPQYDIQADDVLFDGVAGTAGDVFPDGIYKAVYNVTDVSGNYEATKYFFCDYYLRCCINKKAAAIDITDCNCDNEAVCSFLKIWSYWKAVHEAVKVGQYNRALAIYSLVYALCLDTNCGC